MSITKNPALKLDKALTVQMAAFMRETIDEFANEQMKNGGDVVREALISFASTNPAFGAMLEAKRTAALAVAAAENVTETEVVTA